MRIVAAMSGGVDSSVAAARLQEQGYEVIGVHMKLHNQPTQTSPSSNPKRCCGLDDAMDARRVAEKLGIPFYVMDMQKEFQKGVVDYFTSEYLAGRTPNPCIQCNGILKFDLLFRRAQALGAQVLATGHYARLSETGMSMAKDPDKDQTYFLFPMRPEVIPNIRFPLGGLTKAEVREEARRFGLTTAEKPESQEICFIPSDDHARFIRRAKPQAEGAGLIKHIDGRILGEHDGYWRYTVGQRRGLGVALGEPVYVLRVEPHSKTVIVGPNSALAHHQIRARQMNWFKPPDQRQDLQARIRHRGALIPCDVVSEGNDATISFQAPVRAAAPGQAVVLYRGEEVVGGGWIQDVNA